jgi:hypothetical protein
MAQRIKGVIFDMDGLMLDTEKLLTRFWCEAAAFYGFDMQRQQVLGIRSLAAKYAQVHLKGIFGEDFDYYAARAKRIELMNAYIAQNGIEKKQGLDELLESVNQVIAEEGQFISGQSLSLLDDECVSRRDKMLVRIRRILQRKQRVSDNGLSFLGVSRRIEGEGQFVVQFHLSSSFSIGFVFLIFCLNYTILLCLTCRSFSTGFQFQS